MGAVYPQAEVRTLVANHRVQEQMPSVVVEAIFRLIQHRYSTEPNRTEISPTAKTH